MPKFYLHLNEQDIRKEDPDGMELHDLAAAKVEARESMREIIAEHLTSATELKLRSIEICNDAGETLAKVSLADAISGVVPVETFEEDLRNYLNTRSPRPASA